MKNSDLHHKIVREARSWIGTKFQHQGRFKKSVNFEGGCDCLGLVIGVSQALGLITTNGQFIHDLDELNYSIYPDSEKLQKILISNLDMKNKDEIHAGDLALLSIANTAQHLAIISNINYENKTFLGIIHAYHPTGYVCEHIFTRKWKSRLVEAYKLNRLRK